MKKEKYLVELECLMQDEVQNPNGLHYGNLSFTDHKACFIEAAPSRPHTRNPKPMNGEWLSLVHESINSFTLSTRKKNLLLVDNPIEAGNQLKAEFLKAWKIAHGIGLH